MPANSVKTLRALYDHDLVVVVVANDRVSLEGRSPYLPNL